MLYETAREVLMFDGFIDPDKAHHLAWLIDEREPLLLDAREFGSAQAIVGNTLHGHKALSYRILPCHWGFRLQFRRLWAAFRRRRDRTCMCGWFEPGKIIEYHQADMINEAMLSHIRRTQERIDPTRKG